MRQTIITFLALANLSLVSAVPVGEVTDELLNKAQEPTWRIQVEQGKPPVTFHGSIQKVMDQLEIDYPQYASKALERIDDDLQAQELAHSTAAPEVEARAALEKRDHNICYNFPVAEERHTNTGIAYLRGIRGDLRIRPGPRACDRISCSHNAAIYLCNDNPFEKWIQSWDDVANGAKACNNECRYFSYDGSLTEWVTSGQRFHDPGLFNVILRYDTC
ncbi:serine threonine protein kinase [Fusarium flagelliforme]|uniref:Serine threonine protein kinase n=1 Tax=Fusarium flagelliforme TaxID=2675880 RepID=A0A395N2G8_9HYPO|nr:serine threonine protein kinase [Fusarium flagelliforme]